MTDTNPDSDIPRSEADRHARGVAAPAPPVGTGPLARREARLAWGMLFRTLFIVALVVVLPLLAVFWISFKPVGLADLRPPEVVLREDLRGRPEAPGDAAEIRYRLRNSSRDADIRGVTLSHTRPPRLDPSGEPREPCTPDGARLTCDFGTIEGGWRATLEIPVTVGAAYLHGDDVAASVPRLTGTADNVLTNLDLTRDTFTRVFDDGALWRTRGITLFYTFFGTIGAIVPGLFAPLLLDRDVGGRACRGGCSCFPVWRRSSRWPSPGRSCSTRSRAPSTRSSSRWA